MPPERVAPWPVPAPPGVFVTATGTEVGKSVVAAVIANTMRAGGTKVSVFKPVLTGLAEPGEPDHHLLRRAAGSKQRDEEIAPYRFDRALSPHLAADLLGTTIERSHLLAGAAAAAAAGQYVICEGVGGLLAPLRLDYSVRDFAADLDLPTVIVALPGLGTINHTLLSVEAARSAGLRLAAIVLNRWPNQPDRIATSNKQTIAAISGLPVLAVAEIALEDPGSWPALDPLSSDPEARLQP